MSALFCEFCARYWYTMFGTKDQTVYHPLIIAIIEPIGRAQELTTSLCLRILIPDTIVELIRDVDPIVI